MLSITTDYARDTGDPAPYLKRIAEAGFSHVHWCHHWNTDFLYAKCEVAQIAAWLKEFGLLLLDLHGSAGAEKSWTAAEEFRRQAGVELVINRLEMTARLGGDAVVMHAGDWEPMCKSLDKIEPYARRLGVRIAIENTNNWPTVRAVLDNYPSDYVGICYDSGHGNLANDEGLAQLASTQDRLIAVHLHDNDGTADQHRLPFSGTVDWAQLTTLLSSSAYTKCISMESNMGKEGVAGEEEFLARAFAAGSRLSSMLDEERRGIRKAAPTERPETTS